MMQMWTMTVDEHVNMFIAEIIERTLSRHDGRLIVCLDGGW